MNNENMNVTNLPNQNYIDYNKPKKKYGMIALGLSLILVGVLLFFYVLSLGNFDEVDGIVWLFAGIYCYVGELPIIVISTIYGIKGLKDENKIPSIASFIINLLKILFVVYVYVIK